MDNGNTNTSWFKKIQLRPSSEAKNALQLLLILTGTIFLAETRGFLHLKYLEGAQSHIEMLQHTFITTILVFPFLYFLSYHPMHKEAKRRLKAEIALQNINENLERIVAQRTEELTQANIALEAEIEERRKIQASLNNERKRLYALLDELPAIVYLKAPDYSIRFANQRFREQIGNPEGQICYELIQNQDAPCGFCPNPQVLDKKQLVRWEGKLSNNRTYQLYDYPFVDIDGTQTILQLGIDISDQKQAESALEQRNRELLEIGQEERHQRLLAESLVEAANALNTSLDSSDVLNLLLRKMYQLVPYDCACIYLVETKNQLKLGTSYHPASSSCTICSPDVRLETTKNAYLSQIINSGQTISIPDISQTPDWYSQSCIEDVQSYLAIPLLSDGHVIGICELENTKPGFFSPKYKQVAEALVSQAVVAIKNSRLFEQVSASQEHLQKLSRRLVDIQENERRHIAKELHDEAGQVLTSLKVGLRLLEKESDKPDFVQEQAKQLMGMTENLMQDLHRLAMHLHPSSLDYLGLVPAIQNYIEHLQKNSALTIQFESIGLDDRLPPQIEITIYRVVQEALTNIIRHAQATQVDVLLKRRNGLIVTVIEDNGIGFNPELVNTSNHLGLFGMRERIETLNGNLYLESESERGTAVVVEVPCAH